jgi:hypothetical protein
MIMKLKEEARAHGGCRASEKKNLHCVTSQRRIIFIVIVTRN